MKHVVLTQVVWGRRVLHLEYVCDTCRDVRRKATLHTHGGGSILDSKNVDWSVERSFGTRASHCTDQPSHAIELIYDPTITKLVK